MSTSTSTTAAAADLTALAASAKQQVLADLTAAGIGSASDLEASAEQYAPRYAAAAVALAAAKVTGSKADQLAASAQITTLDDEVVLDLANAGLLTESAAESTARNVFAGVVGILLSKLLPAVL